MTYWELAIREKAKAEAAEREGRWGDAAVAYLWAADLLEREAQNQSGPKQASIAREARAMEEKYAFALDASSMTEQSVG